MSQKIKAFVVQTPQKFYQRKLSRLPLILVAIVAGAIGTYALVNSFAATPCTLDLDHLTVSSDCPVTKSDTAASGDPVTIDSLWGNIECADISRLKFFTTGGDPHNTANGTPQGNNSYYEPTVLNGDDFYGSRCELGRNERRYGENGGAGTFQLYQQGQHKITFVSIRLPSNFQSNVNAWQTIMQMKQTEPDNSAGNSPILEMQAFGNEFRIESDPAGELWTTSVVTGQWVRFAFDVTYSQNGDGKIKVYVDKNGDGDTLDPGEQSPVITTATLATETQTSLGSDPIHTGDPVPGHLRLGLYHNPSYNCPAPTGCSTDDDNIQVVDLTGVTTTTGSVSPSPPADTTAPTVSLTAPTSGTTVSGKSVAVSANAADDTGVAGVQFKLDGNNLGSEDTASPYTTNWDTTSVGNGTHTLTAAARDAAGNTKTSNAVNVTVNNTAPDTTPPDTTITVNPASSTTSTGASFSFTSTESGSSFECKLDSGSYSTCTSPKAYSSLAIGAHTFSVRATDASGNVDATPATYSWNITNPPDTTEPTVSFASPANNATVSGIVTATANAADNVGVAKVELSLDGNLKMTDTTAPYNYSFDSKTIANGNHTLTAKAYDAAGNSSTSTITINVNNPDITPPNAPTGLNTTATNSTTVKLSWNAASDTGANPTGVVKYNVLRNGVVIAQTTTTSYTDATATAKTNYSYNVQAVDGAGNVSDDSGTATVTTPAAPDTTAPSVPTNLAAAAISASQVNVTWNVSTDSGGSGLAGYNIYRDGTKLNSTPVTGTSYGDSTVNASTTYNYTIEAVDGAGNKSTQTSAVSVTMPNSPDVIAPSTPANLTAKAISTSQVNLAWDASTDTGGSGLAGYNVYRDGTKLNSSPATSRSYSDTSVDVNTRYSYQVEAVDGVGNASAKSSSVRVSTPRPPRTEHGGGGSTGTTGGGSSQSAGSGSGAQSGGDSNPSSPAPGRQHHTVAVRIFGADHQPAIGASVAFSGQTATADSNGVARFSDVAPGKQTVSVGYNGKETSKVISVKDVATQSEPELFNVATVRNVNPLLLAIPVIALLAAGGFFMRPWEKIKFAKASVDNSVADSVITSNHPAEMPSQPAHKLETPGAVYSPDSGKEKTPKD